MKQRTMMHGLSASGYALVTALIFLVLLTLIALAAIKNTGLEAKMSGNNIMRTQAFESSELSRTLLDYTMLDANTFNRGWPDSIGGSVPKNQFDSVFLALLASSSSCSDGFCISKSGTQPIDWWNANTECPSAACVFKPNSLDQDATYQQSITDAGSASTGNTPKTTVPAELAVFKLYTALGSGAGVQMSSGYLGLGRGAAAGGSNLFYYVNSIGHETSTTPQASAQTAALFRDVVRN